MPEIEISLRLDFPNGGRFGPGKAALLREISQNGSISAAARALEMSYPRALKLIDDMNSQFTTPLVETYQGGVNRGGAKVTNTGRSVIAIYNEACELSRTASLPVLSKLQSYLLAPLNH